MAGIMVSASTGVMNSLLTKLTALLGEEYKLLRNVKRDIISLQSELSSMNALLEKLADMEVLDPQTTEWRNQVREMAYDIEDCIDNYMYRLKHEPDKPGSIKVFFRKNIRKIKKLGARHEIAEQIQELKVQVIEANQRRERYKLDAAVSSISCSTNVPIDPRLMALYAEAADLVGIDGPRDELTKLVSTEEQQLKVVSIVGFGGLGKTTLANQVYQQVKEQFHCSAFVSVSQKPDMKKILRNIFSKIKKQECVGVEAWDEEQLIDSIRELLMHKRYFIVIDDIWSVEAWEPIKCALFDNNCGSRIMTTTRNITVAESCCSLQGYVYDLKPLKDADSESLFFKRIFGSINGCPPHLKEISTEIMKKCGGLPLAIITMSGLLSRKSYTKEEWEGVRNSISSGFEKNYDIKKMNMILSLSYNDLPHYLKTCLLYLSIFPEDYTIMKARLIRRWMAEGFIEIVRGRTIEEEAECYFNELINRSMIQPTHIDHYGQGQAQACRVHDMIRDLIISKAVEENFVTFVSNQEHRLVAKDKVRRLSLDYHDKKCAIILSKDVSHVRSLIVFGGYSKQIPPLLDFRALRVFDVEGTYQLKNHHLKYIGELVQLRYIQIAAIEVTELPEQIGELQYLETLDLHDTTLRGLPASIVKLQRLKHLLLNEVKLPEGIGNMHALEELIYVYVDESCSMTCLQELGNLTKLRALRLFLRISGSDDEKRRYADNLVLSLSKLGSFNLRCLSLYANFEISFDSWSPRPHLLWRLSIDTFYLCKISEWISSLTNLICLEIKVSTFRCEHFKILGDLPALVSLRLISLAVAPEERLIVVGSGRFPCLKSFHLYCQDFVLLFEAGAMPKLEDVIFCSVKAQGVISTCGNAPNLGIHHLSALKHLEVMINCRDAQVEEVEALEAAIRNVASLFPKQPKLILHRYYEEQMVMKDGERKSSDG